MIEPIYGLAVFFSELPTDPNYYTSVEPCCVGQELTQVRMISCFQLIFYDHELIAP